MHSPRPAENLLIESQEEVRSDLRSRKFAQIRSIWLDQEMAQNPTRIDRKKQPAALNLRSHSLDKLRQIITTGAL
jgi:hypothetical protein